MNTYNFEQNAMGTRVSIIVHSYNPREKIAVSIEKAFQVFEELEQQFSLFREDSAVSHINRHAGQIMKVSPLMLDVVSYAVGLARETNGIFNPLIGTLTTPEGLSKTTNPRAYEKIVINYDDQTLMIPAGTALDVNSVVKGLAIDMAMECMANEANVMIEAGGDIRLKGSPPQADFWKIGIRNPQEPRKIITVLQMKSGAICSSGEYFRKEKATQEHRYHLVNPHNNHIRHCASSMTVIAPTAKEADALSTAAYFMSIEKAAQFVEEHPASSCLMIDQNNEVLVSPQMKAHFAIA